MPTLTVFQLFCGVNKCDKTPTRSLNTKHASLSNKRGNGGSNKNKKVSLSWVIGFLLVGEKN